MFDRLIQFIIDSIKLFKFFAVLRLNEAGVILRFGGFHRMAKLRWNWMWPFEIEELFYEQVKLGTIAVGPQSITTKDGVAVVASLILQYQIADIYQFLIETKHGYLVLDNIACGVMTRKIMDHTWDELIAMDLADELAKIIRRKVKKIGVEIIEVQVADFTRSLSFRLIGHQLMQG